MTKKEMFNFIATVNADNADIVAFCEHEIELLNARKGGKRGMTKTQKENEVIMEVIASALGEFDHPVTITELNRGCEDLAPYTSQKLSALMRKLVEKGAVVRVVEKKVARFTLA